VQADDGWRFLINPEILTAETQRAQRRMNKFLIAFCFLCVLCVSAVNVLIHKPEQGCHPPCVGKSK
jgi:hypothetical protein